MSMIDGTRAQPIPRPAPRDPISKRDRDVPYFAVREEEVMSTVSPANRGPRSLQSANLQTPVVPSLIARALADEGYYSDGPPTWPGAPKSKDAKNTRKRYIKRLWRFSSQFPEVKRLANVLTRCRPRRRCMSGACPECGRAFQRWFVFEVAKLAGNADAADLKSISIIFSKHRTAEDQLPTLDTTGMKRSMSETIKDADRLTWMVGGVDLSLNDDTQKKRDIAWQPQLYAIANADIDPLSKVLRDTFRPDKIARRPVQIKECDGSTKAISYAFKTEFVRRFAYRTEVGPLENCRKCWHTRKVSLRAGEHAQTMLWMHKVGFSGRLFLRGVRMTRIGNSVGLVQIQKLE